SRFGGSPPPSVTRWGPTSKRPAASWCSSSSAAAPAPFRWWRLRADDVPGRLVAAREVDLQQGAVLATRQVHFGNHSKVGRHAAGRGSLPVDLEAGAQVEGLAHEEGRFLRPRQQVHATLSPPPA